MEYKYSLFLFIIAIFKVRDVYSATHECINRNFNIAKQKLDILVPTLRSNKSRGDAGIIGVIGGSIEYTGPPYLAAMGALRTGADLVLIITTEEAAPVIKGYQPDLVVYPYLNFKSAPYINLVLIHMDVVVVGAGVGRSEESMTLLYFIIRTCKAFRKPIIIDGDGHFIISREPAIIQDYPNPGCIMTPNNRAAKRLQAVFGNKTDWYHYWGAFVSVLVKGERDRLYSPLDPYSWTALEMESGRRAAGQGDILVGCLATIYNWALKKIPYCGPSNSLQLYQSISAYAANKLVKTSNIKGFLIHGRSMIATDMIGRIHVAFEQVFRKSNGSM